MRRRIIFGVVSGLGFILAVAALGLWFLHREMDGMHATGDVFLASHPDASSVRAEVFAVSAGPQNASATFFLVHGSPGDWRDFGAYFADEELTAQVRIVAPDRPGYGQSPTGAIPPSLPDQAARLAAWAESIPGKHYWLGHSFGASIVARLAMDRPDLTDGIILLAGAMDARWEKPRWFHAAANTGLARRLLPQTILQANAEALAYHVDLAAMEPDWKRIRCPVVIIHARNDSLADFRHVAFTQERLPSDSLQVIALEDGDHFLPWNRKPVVVEAIRRMASQSAGTN